MLYKINDSVYQRILSHFITPLSIQVVVKFIGHRIVEGTNLEPYNVRQRFPVINDIKYYNMYGIVAVIFFSIQSKSVLWIF